MTAEVFGRFLDVMLPEGGWAVTFSEVYIDESYDDGGADGPLLCVAGYVFEKRTAKEFSRKWAAYLQRKGLPYFHMSECAHGGGVFAGKDCDGIARELIRRTRQDTLFGFAIALRERDYDELIGAREGMRSAYSFALMAGMQAVRKWKERAKVQGPTSFFFEAGHKHQRDANEWLTWMLGSPGLQQSLGYSGHAFIPKPTPGLHPADNLAWHWRLEASRILEGSKRRRQTRGDFLALRRPTDAFTLYSRERLEAFNLDLIAAEVGRAARIQLAEETGVIPTRQVFGR